MVADVELVEGQARVALVAGEVGQAAGGEVVDRHHLVAAGEQQVDQVAALGEGAIGEMIGETPGIDRYRLLEGGDQAGLIGEVGAVILPVGGIRGAAAVVDHRDAAAAADLGQTLVVDHEGLQAERALAAPVEGGELAAAADHPTVEGLHHRILLPAVAIDLDRPAARRGDAAEQADVLVADQGVPDGDHGEFVAHAVAGGDGHGGAQVDRAVLGQVLAHCIRHRRCGGAEAEQVVDVRGADEGHAARLARDRRGGEEVLGVDAEMLHLQAFGRQALGHQTFAEPHPEQGVDQVVGPPGDGPVAGHRIHRVLPPHHLHHPGGEDARLVVVDVEDEVGPEPFDELDVVVEVDEFAVIALDRQQHLMAEIGEGLEQAAGAVLDHLGVEAGSGEDAQPAGGRFGGQPGEGGLDALEQLLLPAFGLDHGLVEEIRKGLHDRPGRWRVREYHLLRRSQPGGGEPRHEVGFRDEDEVVQGGLEWNAPGIVAELDDLHPTPTEHLPAFAGAAQRVLRIEKQGVAGRHHDG
ncbi:MAG: hypothetical protein L6R48_08685 [Planctomycetes bacterium]|nr:hypothetical protein [Planctomycetota bacterium]